MTKIYKYFALAILITVQSFIYSQTNVSGTITEDATWTAANSPYRLTGDTEISKDITLTIEPGVEVSGDNYKLTISGTLACYGLSNSVIYFENLNIEIGIDGIQNSEFNNIDFSSVSISYTGITDINWQYPAGFHYSLNFYECKLINSHISSQGSGSINLNNCFLKSSSTKAYEWGNFCMHLKYYDCEISNSDLLVNAYWSVGLSIYNSVINKSNLNSGMNHLLNNKINDCIITTRGLNSTPGLPDVTDLYLKKNLINETQLNFDKGGLVPRPITAKIDSCVIIYDYEIELDFINDDPTSLTEINYTTFHQLNGSFKGAAIDDFKGVVISNSTFSNNYYGINFSGESTIKKCNFINNCSYSLISNSNHTISVDSVFFNSSTPDINNHILENSGIINVTNIISEPYTDAPVSPPSDVSKTNTDTGIKLSWTPNPESDIAGYKVYYNPIDEFTFANSIDIGNNTSYTLEGANLSDTIAVSAYDNEADGQNDLIEGHESWYSKEEETVNYNPESEKLFSNNFHVWPNPVRNKLFIKNLNSIKNFKVALYTLNGKKLHTIDNQYLSSEIDISNYKSGIYILKVFNDDKTIQFKIIKE